MCLFIDLNNTEHIRNSNKALTVYKTFRLKSHNGKMYLENLYQKDKPVIIDKDGWIISDRKTNTPQNDELNCLEVKNGIHVYSKFPIASNPQNLNTLNSDNKITIKATGYIKDFVASNYIGDHLVFTKIKVNRKELFVILNKAVKDSNNKTINSDIEFAQSEINNYKNSIKLAMRDITIWKKEITKLESDIKKLKKPKPCPVIINNKIK